MLTKPQHCRSCPIHGTGRGFSNLEGSCRNGVLVIAEALGENEAIDGLPLRPYAQAGSMFQRTVNDLGLKRDDFGITNIVRCRPPGNILDGADYELEAIARCHTFLVQAVDYFKPKVILALGNVPLRALTGLSGKRKTVTHLRGYVQWNKEFGLPVVPTLHPAFLARGKKNLLGVFGRDMDKALRIAHGELKRGVDYFVDPQREYKNEYNLAPSEANWWYWWQWFKDNPGTPVAFDIETKESLVEDSEEDVTGSETFVTQFQISARKGHALVLEREGRDEREFFGLISNFLSLPNIKLSWNGWNFDEPVLENFGVRIDPKTHYDLMTAFRHWQPDVPSHLQSGASFFGFPFAWKHLSGESLPFYGAADVDSLHWIYEPLKAVMEKEGIW